MNPYEEFVPPFRQPMWHLMSAYKELEKREMLSDEKLPYFAMLKAYCANRGITAEVHVPHPDDIVSAMPCGVSMLGVDPEDPKLPLVSFGYGDEIGEEFEEVAIVPRKIYNVIGNKAIRENLEDLAQVALKKLREGESDE